MTPPEPNAAAPAGPEVLARARRDLWILGWVAALFLAAPPAAWFFLR